ncbi:MULTISPECIES: hypothetical protein [Glycomyces]|uniref:Uncharacterized protein n=2 Tax=Glycomyces TaxID=58113 RepID=A0A9X3PIJ0_9ACTN|nr:hypothetical protein [Glycomyces lechevalierae]MDA1384386.1 hypothetical protein [Glycomyces lechevalierae]MDR7339180.1 hypothetical protein [Glycomyces lechevalierae]
MTDESMEELRDPFEFVDDDEETDEELEEEILDATDYAEADRFGMTADEERRGAPLSAELAAEEPEVWEEQYEPGPGDPIPDEPAEPEPEPESPPPDEPAPPTRL